MLKTFISLVLGFSAGTYAGIRIHRFKTIAKIHKDLADQFEASESLQGDGVNDRQDEVT